MVRKYNAASLQDAVILKPLGPRSAAVIRRIERHSAQNYAPYPFVVEKADGAWLYDPDGNRALDFLSAYSAVLSHRHPEVIKAVRKEMERGSDLVSRALYSVIYADFVEAVCNATGYDRVLPKSDGGSATDSALKTLLIHGRLRGVERPEVILTNDYFHGRTLPFASNALFDEDQSFGLTQRMPGIVVVDHNPQAVESAINDNTVGIFVETHKGEGGPLFTKEKDFRAMRKLAKKNGIYFGVDEIQTGLGRCGYMMAWQEFGADMRPDFVTLGKALGGGVYPVSVLAGTEEFMGILKPGVDGSTFGGNPIACAAACASLGLIKEEKIPARSRKLGAHFAKRLRNAGISVENKGLLMRVEIEAETAKYACLEMLLGKNRNPRVFMKHGHAKIVGGNKIGSRNIKARRVAYARIAPPPGAITEELIDLSVENTIGPVLQQVGHED